MSRRRRIIVPDAGGNEYAQPFQDWLKQKDSLFPHGATTLENFGVEVDPIEKKLKPILAIIGGYLASC